MRTRAEVETQVGDDLLDPTYDRHLVLLNAILDALLDIKELLSVVPASPRAEVTRDPVGDDAV